MNNNDKPICSTSDGSIRRVLAGRMGGAGVCMRNVMLAALFLLVIKVMTLYFSLLLVRSITLNYRGSFSQRFMEY